MTGFLRVLGIVVILLIVAGSLGGLFFLNKDVSFQYLPEEAPAAE